MNISDYKRIMIVGCGCSGKTTLAFKLAKLVDLPLYHLDQYYWKPGWQRTDSIEFTEAHTKLCNQDRWIIEGSNTSWLPDRIAAADMIIFLDMPRYLSLWRVIKRSFMNYGKEISGSPEGCKQRIMSFAFLEFLKWVWNFNNRSRLIIYDYIDNALYTGKQVIILKSSKEVENFFKK